MHVPQYNSWATIINTVRNTHSFRQCSLNDVKITCKRIGLLEQNKSQHRMLVLMVAMVAKFLNLNNPVPEKNDRNGLSQERLLTSTNFATSGLLTPTSSNIGNWWGRDDRWCHNAWHMMSFVTKNLWKRCCWNCNIFFFFLELYHLTLLVYFPPITLLLILQKHTRVCEETFDVKSTIAQIRQNVWNFIVRKSNQTLAIIREVSDSNLETGRNGSKSGASRIIWESWQPCYHGNVMSHFSSLLCHKCYEIKLAVAKKFFHWITRSWRKLLPWSRTSQCLRKP